MQNSLNFFYQLKLHNSSIKIVFFLNKTRMNLLYNGEALTIIDLDAQNSNVEDFKLQAIREQGISAIKEENGKQNLVYYLYVK